ncbi:MAG TPA: rod shape-determining protein RodA [bacterium]|nr:rod shape-determining protein RodA [bacterium]
MRFSIKNFWRIDVLIIVSVFLLILIGLINIYSIGLSNPETRMIFFNKQLLYAIVGIILMFIFTSLEYRFLKTYYKIFIIMSALLLIVVLIMGRVIRGTNAWLEFFGLQFQPVELAKICLIIFLATYLSKNAKEFYFSWKPILTSGIVAFILITLVLAQPDMGSALILFAIWLIMILFTNIDKKKIIIMAFIILILLGGAWFGFFKDYQKKRIMTFLNPASDPLGYGYNVTQSMTAIGSGKFLGRGFGLGSQSQLNFLPEQRTDFIFAVISEEFGFLGSSITILLIILFLSRIIKIIKNTSDNLAIYMALGFMVMFFVQSIMNIMMNIGLAPVIGVPLPFVSYGGSSLLMSLIAVGILESIVIHKAEYL